MDKSNAIKTASKNLDEHKKKMPSPAPFKTKKEADEWEAWRKVNFVLIGEYLDAVNS